MSRLAERITDLPLKDDLDAAIEDATGPISIERSVENSNRPIEACSFNDKF